MKNDQSLAVQMPNTENKAVKVVELEDATLLLLNKHGKAPIVSNSNHVLAIQTGNGNSVESGKLTFKVDNKQIPTIKREKDAYTVVFENNMCLTKENDELKVRKCNGGINQSFIPIDEDKKDEVLKNAAEKKVAQKLAEDTATKEKIAEDTATKNELENQVKTEIDNQVNKDVDNHMENLIDN